MLQAQRPVPEPMPTAPQVYRGLVIHTGDGRRVDNGLIAFEKGRLLYVGEEKDFPGLSGAQEYHLPGAHAYPGFILMDNILGLTETDALKPTHDFAETGDFNPAVRTCVAFNTDSKIIPTVRSNGVLITQATPRGSLLAGISSVMRLDAWNWEDAAIRCNEGVHVYWPPRPVRRKAEEPEKKENEPDPEQLRQNRLDQLRQLMEQAKAYVALGQGKDEENLHLRALVPLFQGTQSLYVHASGSADILEAVTFFRQFGNMPLVVCGFPDTGLVLDVLKREKIPVVLPRLHALPWRDDLDHDIIYRLPLILKRRNVVFALSYRGDMEAMGSRNLPFVAGSAVAYGLPYEEAVAAVTSVPARILGIDQDYGTLQPGKSATFFISRGDALDMRSNDVLVAFMDGRPINLDSHQKELYRQYLKKYGLN